MKTRSRSLKIKLPSGSVSAILDLSPTPKIKAAIALAHGAGAGMRHAFMSDLAQALARAGFAVLRYQFPYMEAGRSRTDSPAIATATVKAAVETLRTKISAPIFAAGKSYGSRMTTTAASEGLLTGVRGIICYGFPLHPPYEPSTTRAEHLARNPLPTLFLQGTRDDLADLRLMRGVCKKLGKMAKLHIVDGADHGFEVLKRSGRTDAQVLEELVAETLRFAGTWLSNDR